MSGETRKVRGVLFDMDGLMRDTERPCIEAWVEAGKIHGLPVGEDAPRAAIGRDEKSCRMIFLEKYGEDFPYDLLLAEVSAIVRRKEEEGIALRPGLLLLLDHLASLGLPLAVATSTARERALQKLGKAGILHYFKEAAFGDEVTKGKPAPDIFLLAARRLQSAPEDCVGFEDSPAGLRSLAAAGIRSVFVKDIVEPDPEVLSLVWRRFESLDQAIPLFPQPR
jgi:HAD superfamily hydrolase (TIGR01509 family)